ncbi:hypothetical protein BMJ29_19625, partial [Sinorhizobium medicae]
CLAAKADVPHSHDNLFHSVLGLMQVKTQVQDPALDIFAACRNVSSIYPVQARQLRPSALLPDIRTVD